MRWVEAAFVDRFEVETSFSNLRLLVFHRFRSSVERQKHIGSLEA